MINCSKRNSCISTGHDELYTLSFEALGLSVTPTYVEKYFIAGDELIYAFFLYLHEFSRNFSAAALQCPLSLSDLFTSHAQLFEMVVG